VKNLIVNLGPLGDVVRTTVLLRQLNGENYWLTKKKCKDVLNSKKIKKTFFFDNESDLEELLKHKFDLLISLNEESEALNIVKNLKYEKLIGIYYNSNGEIDYTPESRYWFDMSLSSKFGKENADKLKMMNCKSYPQILIEMVGGLWDEQEYDLGIPSKKIKGKIGLIKEVTGIWKNKGWAFYDDLKDKLELEGYAVDFLGLKQTVREHIDDINNCEIVICGDTLGMHLALALNKKIVTIFNCTSANEIHDYGRLTKVVSPFCEKYFYKTGLNNEAIRAVSLEEVYKTFKKLV